MEAIFDIIAGIVEKFASGEAFEIVKTVFESIIGIFENLF